MPIYEYVCQSCGEPLEKLQKLADAPLTDCPACGEAALKRKVSAAGFRLSGGGWYETDFKSDGKRNLANGNETASKKSDTGDNSGSKSKDSSSTQSTKKTGGENKPASSNATKSAPSGD